MDKKDKILLIFLSIVLVLFIPLCVFAGFRYFGKSTDNNKTNEKEEPKDNEGNKEDEIVINYPREMTSDEYNVYGSAFTSDIQIMNETLDESVKKYKDNISFNNYKHNTSIEVRETLLGHYGKKVTIKNGVISTSSKENAPTLVGIEGKPIAIESSCNRTCDIVVLTEEGELFYSYVGIDPKTRDFQTTWTFNEIKLEEKVNKIKTAMIGPFYNRVMVYEKIQSEAYSYKNTILFETNTGVYKLYSNDQNGINISKTTIDKSFNVVAGIPFITDTKGYYFLAMDTNKNVKIVEADGLDFKIKDLLTKDNKKVVVKKYFSVYDRNEELNNEYGQNIIYFISEDDYLYYYVGGDELKRLEDSKVKKFEIKGQYDETVIEITFEGSDDYDIKFERVEEEFIEDNECYDEEFCD